MSEGPKLYRELAGWFHLLTAPEEYAEEAERYRAVLAESGDLSVRMVLELGSGGGNNASFLKEHFQMTLVDLSPEMLAESRKLNPECEHVEGDMRTVRLGREFDAVFVHDAVSYITTQADLAATIETAAVHCRAGGVALFVPDYIRESFRPGTDHGGNDGDGRGLRYLEWVWDPDPDDDTFVTEYAYMMRERDGAVRVVHDRHHEGAFRRDVWLALMEEAGFRAEARPTGEQGAGQEMFVGVKAGG